MSALLAPLATLLSSPPEAMSTGEGVLAQADMASLPYNPVRTETHTQEAHKFYF